jgi:hypothetical protein
MHLSSQLAERIYKRITVQDIPGIDMRPYPQTKLKGLGEWIMW